MHMPVPAAAGAAVPTGTAGPARVGGAVAAGLALRVQPGYDGGQGVLEGSIWECQ